MARRSSVWLARAMLGVTLLFSLTCRSRSMERPRVDSINPPLGYEGQAVTIEALGYFPARITADFTSAQGLQVETAYSMTLGGKALAEVSYVDPYLLVAVVPSEMRGGVYDIVVTGPTGVSDALRRAFTLVARPRDDGNQSGDADPGDPGGDPSTPGDPGGDPSTPGDPGGDPSTPGDPGGDPSTPGDPGRDPCVDQCACPETQQCSFDCMSSTCDITCEGGTVCDIDCANGCHTECLGDATCHATCQAGCTARCIGTSSCQLTCTGDCSITACVGSAECILSCTDPTNCALSCPSADLRACGNGLFACRTACP